MFGLQISCKPQNMSKGIKDRAQQSSQSISMPLNCPPEDSGVAPATLHDPGRRVGHRAGRGVAHPDPEEHHDVLGEELHDVGERQEGDVDVVPREDDEHEALERGHEVAV